MLKRFIAGILAVLILTSFLPESYAAASDQSPATLEEDALFCCGTEPQYAEFLHNELLQRRARELQAEADIVPFSIMPNYNNRWPLMPSTGNVKMLVLPIAYSDYPEHANNYDPDAWEKYFFAEYDPTSRHISKQSVRGYYQWASNGKLDITGTVLPVYTAPEPSSYYYSSSLDLFVKAEDLVLEALRYYAEQGFDFSDYDNDGDGIIDALVVRSLRPYRVHFTNGYSPQLVGEYKVAAFAFTSIVMASFWDPINGSKPIESFDEECMVCAHEIAHLMGLPDNYLANGTENELDVWLYELMQSGSSECVYINVYYKYLLGWIDPIILTEDDGVKKMELYPVEPFPRESEGAPEAIVLIPDSNAFPFTEYYIVEYRAGGTVFPLETAIFGKTPGIVIWHCNTYINNYGNYSNKNNYLKPVYKSNTEYYNTKDIFITGDEFSSSTTPNSHFYDETYTGAYLKVENIMPDKAVLQIGFRDPPLLPGPVLEVSRPTKKVLHKGEKSVVSVKITVGGQPIPLNTDILLKLMKFSTTGTVTGAGGAAQIAGDFVELVIPGESYPELGDGTMRVDIPAGALRYNGKDSNAVISEEVIIDNTAPEIALNGENPQKIQQGAPYTELGAIASDNLDPDIESKLQIDASAVDTNSLGTYTVNYSVTDHADHTASVERTVIIEAPHTHQFSDEWSGDGANHWHECECGEKADLAVHDAVTDPAVEPTCTVSGKTAGSHCSVCGKVLQAQTTVPTRGHDYSSQWSSDDTHHWKQCTRCDAKRDVAEHVKDSGTVTKAPTEEETGLRTFCCSSCGRVLETEVIPKLEPSHTHVFGSTWRSDGANHWHECECGEKADLAAHDVVTDPAVEPTCTTPGKTEGSHCSVCGKTLQAQATVDPKGHTPSSAWSSDATDHWHVCTACREEMEKAAHVWNAGTVTTAPTATQPGVRTYTCTVCARTRTESIPATGGSSGGGGGGGGGGMVAPATYEIILAETRNGTVQLSDKKAEKGATITVTAVPEEGYRLEKITAADARKKEVALTDKGQGVYTFTMPASKVTVAAEFVKEEVVPPEESKAPEPIPVTERFTDIKPEAWYVEAVQYVSDAGLMRGMDETTFAPKAVITRGAIVTILHRMEGEPGGADHSFRDVPPGQWYADGVSWASASGIVQGFGDDTFRPEEAITREQLVTILYRYAQQKGYDMSAQADLSGFIDQEKISAYARPAMAWAKAVGLITGADWGGLHPQGTASRSEVAAILMRFCEKIGN